MTTINLSFRQSKSGNGNLFYQVFHLSTKCEINSGIRIKAEDWDEVNESIISPTPKYLLQVEKRISQDISSLQQIAKYLQRRKKNLTAKEIVQQFKNRIEYHPFTEFATIIIDQLRQNGHTRTSETYLTTVNCFARFRSDVMLEDIDSDMMLSFEAWMRNRGLTKNTTSFYMRIMRAIYNRAIERGLIKCCNPFKHVYTGIDKTIKRAISLNAIRKLKTLDLSTDPKLSLARDIFLFSFYTRGMSFVDIAYLRKNNLDGKKLRYRRRKTNQLLVIGWEECMQEIVERHHITSSPYLFPIITQSDNERMQYIYAAHRINRYLKILGEMIKLNIPLTMYVARHSWASIARDKHIPLSIISQSMGHESEATTRIYLSTIDHNEIDRANRAILRSI